MKVGVIYRAKVDDQYYLDKFIASIKKSATFSDGIFVLDAGSKINLSITLKEQEPEIWKLITKYERVMRAYNPSQDFDDGIQWGKEAKMDWILSLTSDEIVEDKLDRKLLDKLINPPNPAVMAYILHPYFFWDYEDAWRFDAPWGEANEIRLARLTKNSAVLGIRNNVFIPQKSPQLPPECVRVSGIRIKNYTYVKEEHRQKLIESLEKMGVGKKPSEESFLFYKSLVDGFRKTLYPWVEESTMSVYTPLKYIGGLLEGWMDTVWPIADEIIIGDDGMSKSDLRQVQKWGAKIVPVVMGNDYSAARNKLLRSCSKRFIFQLDLDENLGSWWELRRMLDVPVSDAWLFSVNNWQKDKVRSRRMFTETMRLFKNDGMVSYWGMLHETIDEYAKRAGWTVGSSPVTIDHYGYLINSDREQHDKMQKYIASNLKQIEKHPKDGRAYYNLALHLLEDDMVDDAVRLLELSTLFSPNYMLPAVELGKSYLTKAKYWLARAKMLTPPRHREAREFLEKMDKTIDALNPPMEAVSKGHAVEYFTNHGDRVLWLRDHVNKMTKLAENAKIDKVTQGIAQGLEEQKVGKEDTNKQIGKEND